MPPTTRTAEKSAENVSPSGRKAPFGGVLLLPGNVSTSLGSNQEILATVEYDDDDDDD